MATLASSSPVVYILPRLTSLLCPQALPISCAPTFITSLQLPEAGGQVHRHVLVALLKAIVLPDVVEIVPADDNGPLHLHLGHHTWGARGLGQG